MEKISEDYKEQLSYYYNQIIKENKSSEEYEDLYNKIQETKIKLHRLVYEKYLKTNK